MQPNDTITFSLAELKKFIKVPGVDTVTFTPDEWNYFAEKLVDEAPRGAMIERFFDAKILAKITVPPREFETPQYPYVPYGDKSPGIDAVDLTPDEWSIFVEEVQTKSPFTAFNNAKYVAEIRSRFDSFKANSKSSN